MKKSLAIIFSIATILRLGFTWLAPAWYDESFTLLVTRLPFDRMLAAVAGDVHPPLWYLLLWPLGQLQAPIWVLRIPAALLSLASVGIFWSILQALDISPRVRTAALVLMAVMPIQLYYAMEARMYSLLEFLVLLGFWSLLKRRWILFTLAGIGMLYTQYYGAFYFAALCLVGFVIYKTIRDFRRYFYICVSIVVLSFVPWLLVLKSQMGTLQGSYWMQLTGVGMVLRVLFDDLFLPPQNAVLQIPLMLAGFAWLIASLIYVFKHQPMRQWTIFVMAFAPFVFSILVSLLWQPILHYRPLIAITPFLYILLASPVDELFKIHFHQSDEFEGEWIERLSLRRLLLALSFELPVLLICIVNIYLYARVDKTPTVTSELAYINAHALPGDIIYHFSDDSWVNAAAVETLHATSLHATSLPSYKSPDCAPVLGALSPQTRLALGMDIRPLSDIPFRRAWIIWSDSPLEPPCNLAQKPAAAPVLVAADDEYVFEGLWLVEK